MAASPKEPPADHIFGDLDRPEHAVAWLNDRLKGVHHYSGKDSANPKPGESVRLVVTCSADLPVESV
ncbi:MAG: hypothetical protein ACNA70_09615, partial [Brevefilum sp.]